MTTTSFPNLFPGIALSCHCIRVNPLMSALMLEGGERAGYKWDRLKVLHWVQGVGKYHTLHLPIDLKAHCWPSASNYPSPHSNTPLTQSEQEKQSVMVPHMIKKGRKPRCAHLRLFISLPVSCWKKSHGGQVTEKQSGSICLALLEMTQKSGLYQGSCS